MHSIDPKFGQGDKKTWNKS